jgi:hypothetical protein
MEVLYGIAAVFGACWMMVEPAEVNVKFDKPWTTQELPLTT